ncbi:MAG: rhodanese-like domain-containing protein [Paludibacteraceae bacterium]
MKNVKCLLLALAAGLCGCRAQQFSNIDADAFAQLITNADVQLVDVRTPAEFAQGHIADALLIDFKAADFDALCAEKLDKSRPVAIYCRSGKRSAAAAQRLVAAGFEVYNLQGGILEWTGSGKPLAMPASVTQ